MMNLITKGGQTAAEAPLAPTGSVYMGKHYKAAGVCENLTVSLRAWVRLTRA
jgi:hypothetical protein